MRIQRFALCTLVFSVGLWWAPMPPAQAADTPTPSAPDGLTLEEALDHASRNRQELKGFRADLDAAAVKLKHAGLPPNPELRVEWDNLGSDLPADDVKETTVALSQPFEIGGKPSARKNKGQAEIMRLQHEQSSTWLDIATEVKLAFLEVLGARERLTLQHEAEQIASELANITHERVAAGDLAATEETRAEARKAEMTAETLKLKRILTEAELNFVMALGEADSALVTVSGQLAQEVAIPDRHTLLAGIQNSPMLAPCAEVKRGLPRQASRWSRPTPGPTQPSPLLLAIFQTRTQAPLPLASPFPCRFSSAIKRPGQRLARQRARL